jgi:hypothetical protein
MRYVLNNTVLAFIFATQSLWFAGCTMEVTKPFQCECDCNASTFKCNGMTVDNKLKY